jgi:hypothetical protein
MNHALSLMTLVILVTVARFAVRWKGGKKHKSFTLADIFVVPAAVCLGLLFDLYHMQSNSV